MDATVRPSHGRPYGHRPTVRLTVCPSVIVYETTLVQMRPAFAWTGKKIRVYVDTTNVYTDR
jgi:hypothetical protein